MPRRYKTYPTEKPFVKRRLEQGIEIVSCPLPLVVTVNSSAAECRPRNARRLMKYKQAKTVTERQNSSDDYIKLISDRPYLNINEITVADIEVDREELGLSGSPTKVKKIENVVFQAKEAKVLQNDNEEIELLIKELVSNHTLN